ncbi:uncharacterized protein F5147DRAFT_771279 [Suillus discolor]|uniref:Uncharacterized protein n=1 Tax=Suillus discolor TaxID=1912936 RepID=A0A9P7FAA6_9AGAM|nr:uncharacterized protein F5147DRAFT_771279 [Suillus discolor]KAG2112215.1 hypothetical protein F5147DRAFT_771279 [Suillus discolor]
MILILTELTLYYFDYICECRISSNLRHAISSNLEGPIPNWADKVATQTQLKPCVPPSIQASARIAQHQLADSNLDLDDEPEEYSELTPTMQRGKNIVHVKEKPKLTLRGKKHSFQNVEHSAEELNVAKEFNAAEEFKMQQNPDAAEDPNTAEGFEEDEETAKDEGHASVAQHTSSMSVDVSNQKTTRQHTKGEGKSNTKVEAQVKTEVEAPANIHLKIRKGKAKNSNLPSGFLKNGVWRSKFIPCLMFWVGNSNHA